MRRTAHVNFPRAELGFVAASPFRQVRREPDSRGLLAALRAGEVPHVERVRRRVRPRSAGSPIWPTSRSAASIAITYGFTNALIAVLLAAVVIFLTSIPIAYYSAKYSIDMDLLTRGAGFGYLGSTITSVIYASFTFIFFALEGSIMAQALQPGFGIPLWLGYLLGALVIIPLVCFGMTLLSKLQVWTQPIWLILMFAPFVAILVKDPNAFAHWTHFKGNAKSSGFDGISMGLGAGIALSLIAQIGEQVDYLRFMPIEDAGERAASGGRR